MTDHPSGPPDPDLPSAVRNSPVDTNDVLTEFAPLPYQSLDPDGEILTVNDSWCDLLGYERDAVVGRWFGEFLGPEGADRFECRFPTFKAEGGVSDVEFDMVRADGEIVPVAFFGTIEYDEEGGVCRTHCQFRDVSDRKAREAELRTSRRAFQDLFDGLNDAVFVHDIGGSFRLVNETAVERLGYSEETLLGMTPSDLDAPGHDSRIADRRDRLRREGSLTFETVHVSASGERIPVEVSSSVVEFFGDPTILSVARDVSERKQREKDSELFRTLVDQAGDGIFVIDESTGDLVDVNQTACELLDEERGTLLGRPISDISGKFESRQDYLAYLSDPENAHPAPRIHEYVRSDGSTVTVRVSARSVSVGTERYRVKVARDVSDRIERERDLRRMRRAVDASGHAVYVTDPHGIIQYVNPAFEEITGYSAEAALGTNPRILNSGEMSAAYFEDLWETVLGGEVWEEEVVNRRQSGSIYHAHQTIAPIHEDGDDEIEGFVAIQTDVTDRIGREAQLAKRERSLRELHSINTTFIAAETESVVFDGIVDALSNALDLSRFGVLQYVEESGCLEAATISSEFIDRYGDLASQEPGDNAIWTAFARDETRMYQDLDTAALGGGWQRPASELLVVPIQGHGVILVVPSAAETLEAGDVELVELLAANAEAILSRLQAESRLAERTDELSLQETRIAELETLIGAVESIQHRLAESDTKESLVRAVCEELTRTDVVDFAWIGQPEVNDTLSISAWAGQNRGFLDAVSFEAGKTRLPSERAVRERRPVSIDRISKCASEESWAADALSRQFNSVLSIPLVHDDVLYGVMTMYSTAESAFGSRYRDLFAEVGTLVANYLSILNIRYADSSHNLLEIEFRVQDSNYQLSVLASATDCTLEFETVLETLDETIRVLVTVIDGDPQTVLDAAGQIPSITEAARFGAARDGQLVLTIQKPFLASEVVEHGGRMVGSVARPSDTRVRITVPEEISIRPLAESLKTRYANIELLARRERPTDADQSLPRVSEYLTERQYEVLKGAYYGGYFESPRGITGEDLAANFGISNTVVHDHLKAGHKRILAHIFDTDAENEGLNN